MSGWPNTCSIAGITLDQDLDDSFRIVEDLPGWDDGPDQRDSITDRAQQDGGWDATPLDGSRVFTIAGTVEEASPAAAMAVRDALSALRKQGLVEFTVANAEVGSRTALARAGKLSPTWLDDSSFTYTLPCKAPDPLKYGDQLFDSADLAAVAGTGLLFPMAFPLDFGVPAGTTPGSVQVANSGTEPYWPRLRMNGPVPNPVATLNETGSWVRFNGTLAAGQWLDWDLANRRVLLNGQVSVRESVSFSGDWLAVPVGGASISWSADASDPAAQLDVWSYEGAWS